MHRRVLGQDVLSVGPARPAARHSCIGLATCGADRSSACAIADFSTVNRTASSDGSEQMVAQPSPRAPPTSSGSPNVTSPTSAPAPGNAGTPESSLFCSKAELSSESTSKLRLACVVLILAALLYTDGQNDGGKRKRWKNRTEQQEAVHKLAQLRYR